LVACHNNPPLGGVNTDAGGGGVIDGDLLQNYREEMQMNSGWQLSGDAPTAYVRFALKLWSHGRTTLSALQDAEMATVCSMSLAERGSLPIASIWSAESCVRLPDRR